MMGVAFLFMTNVNASTVNVSSWAELVSGWNNSAVDKMILTQSFDSTAVGTIKRTKGIEIDGNGNTINFSGGAATQHSLNIRNPAFGQSALLSIHDIKLIATTGEGVQGLIYTDEASTTNRWTIEMSNLSYYQTFNAGQRFATVGGAKVKLSGTIDIRTNYENFVGAQSIDIAPNTKYYGVSNNSSNRNNQATGLGPGPVSVLYMSSSAGNGHIKIGQNATVSLVNYHTGNPYAPIYLHFGQVTVDEGGTLNLNGGSVGINWLSNDRKGQYIVKNNATLSISSNDPKGSASVVDFSSTVNKQGIWIKKNARFFVLGQQTSGIPLINMTGPNRQQFLKLDQPKAFDLNNQGFGNNAAVNLKNGVFQITNSNMTLWQNGVNTMISAASIAFPNVRKFLSTQAGNQSSETNLASTYQNGSTARIAGMNQPFQIYLQPWSRQENPNTTIENQNNEQNGVIWDTDKTVRARIAMGELPISGKPDPITGKLTEQTIWAIKNQLTITGFDSLGHHVAVPTNENGFVTIQNQDFQKATSLDGELIRLSGQYGLFNAMITANVLDKTPPQPVTLTRDFSSNANIKGSSEPGARITGKVSHYGGKTWLTISNQATVDNSGNFVLGEINGLQSGDWVQIFATDMAGNTTPSQDAILHDANLRAATKYQVTGNLEWASQFSQINFGTHPLTSSNVSYAAKENTTETMSVIDSRGQTVTWRITARISKEMTLNQSGAILMNVVFFKDGRRNHLLNSEDTIIQIHQTTSDDAVKVNADWNDKNEGIFLNIPQTVFPSQGTYNGEIEWTLEDVPH